MSLIDWYQHIPSYISPIFLSMGFIEVRWYPLGYVFAITLTMSMMIYRFKKMNSRRYEEIPDIMFFCFLGIVLGGRLGYVLFYQPEYYFYHPEEIFMPFRHTPDGWKIVGISGMSYHGGMTGVAVALYLFGRMKGYNFWNMVDLYTPAGALGHTMGRLGNFMNGELYGRKTTVPWGMYFRNENTGELFEYLRHPSQLYQAFGEGALLAGILYFLQRVKRWKAGMVGCSFYCIGYGCIRFIIEFFRQPDRIFRDGNDDLGVVFYWLTMGQVLCVAMILFGVVTFLYFSRYSHDSIVYFGKPEIFLDKEENQ